MILSSTLTTPLSGTGMVCLHGKNNARPLLSPGTGASVFSYLPDFWSFRKRRSLAVNVLLQALNACFMYQLGCRLGFYKQPLSRRLSCGGDTPVVDRGGRGRDWYRRSADDLIYHDGGCWPCCLISHRIKYGEEAMIFFHTGLPRLCKESAVVPPALADIHAFSSQQGTPASRYLFPGHGLCS